MYKHFYAYKYLYFLWAIFFCSEIIIACNLCKNRYAQFFLTLIPLILFHLTSRRLFNLPYLYPFFLLGYYGYGFDGKIHNKHKLYYVCVFVALLCFWSPQYMIWQVSSNMRYADLHTVFIIGYRLFIGAIGCVAVMYIFDILYEFMSKQKQRLYKFIILSGQETLALYIFQDYICFIIIKNIASFVKGILGYNIFNFNESFLGYVIAPILTLIIMSIILIITRQIRNNKYSTKILGFKIALPN